MESHFGVKGTFLRFIFHDGAFLGLALCDIAQYHSYVETDGQPAGQAGGICQVAPIEASFALEGRIEALAGQPFHGFFGADEVATLL